MGSFPNLSLNYPKPSSLVKIIAAAMQSMSIPVAMAAMEESSRKLFAVYRK